MSSPPISLAGGRDGTWFRRPLSAMVLTASAAFSSTSSRRRIDRQDRHDFWSSRDPAIERMVLFDHLVNNADRKISHCLRDATGKVWGIDHGLTFNREPKLRTVLWQFVGEPISPLLRRELSVLRDRGEELRDTLADVIDHREIESLLREDLEEFAESRVLPLAQS